MVYKFKLVSDEVSNFSREIEIDANSSFLQLRNAILDSVDYTKDDIDSFFLCDDEWQRQEEITLEDMGSSSDQDIWIMEDTPLNELIEEEGQKLVFVFNYLTERSFFYGNEGGNSRTHTARSYLHSENAARLLSK